MSTSPPQTRRVRRYDRSEGLLLRSYKRSADGAILAEGFACSERIQEYLNPDGSIRRELITLQAVKDTAAGIGRAVLTYHHPREWVTPDTYQDASVGDVDGSTEVVETEEDVQGGFCKVKVAVRRRDALQAFEDEGVVELSPGYIAEVLEEPGVWQGQRYDAKQIARPEINHLALVPRGRGGPSIRLRADGHAEPAPTTDSPKGATRRSDTSIPRTAMNNLFTLAGLLGLDVKADAVEAQVIESITPAVKKLLADVASMEGMEKAMKDMGYESMDAMLADMKAAKGIMKDMGCEDMAAFKKAVADLKVKKDAAEADLKKAQARIDAIEDATAQSRLKRLAEGLNRGRAADQQVKLDGLDIKAQRVAVAKARLDSVTADSPAAYVDGVLDLIESEIKADSGESTGSHLRELDDFATPGGKGDEAKRIDARDRFRNPHLDHYRARAAGGDK